MRHPPEQIIIDIAFHFFFSFYIFLYCVFSRGRGGSISRSYPSRAPPTHPRRAPGPLMSDGPLISDGPGAWRLGRGVTQPLPLPFAWAVELLSPAGTHTHTHTPVTNRSACTQGTAAPPERPGSPGRSFSASGAPSRTPPKAPAPGRAVPSRKVPPSGAPPKAPGRKAPGRRAPGKAGTVRTCTCPTYVATVRALRACPTYVVKIFIFYHA